MTFTRPWTVFCTAVAAAAPVGLLVAQATRTPLPTPEPNAASTEWPTYGHDAGGMRYSPLTTITPANVSQLVVAWSYHLKPEGDAGPAGRGGSGLKASEATPLVIDGTMFIASPYGRVVALNATTGKE